MEKYKLIHPDFPERMLKMAEKEQEFRHKQLSKTSDDELNLNLKIINTQKRGQIFALVAIFSILCICIYMIHNGSSEAAADVMKWTLGSTAGIFIVGRIFLIGKGKGRGKE